MNGAFKQPARVMGRLLWLVGECLLAGTRYLSLCWRWGGAPPLTDRARWLQRACRRALRLFALDLRVQGPIPERGLMVCNHLSYLDILILSSVAPCVFVAKSEVRRWPVFGWFARLAGTVFVCRQRRNAVGQAMREMERSLEAGALVVLFPEGTSTGGETVLPFRSSLLEPAVQTALPLTTAFLHYSLADGHAAEEVCYWQDMTLLPHLLNLLSKSGVRAAVAFRAVGGGGGEDRKRLAGRLRAEVLRARDDLHSPSPAKRGLDLEPTAHHPA